jgi:phytol kinase
LRGMRNRKTLSVVAVTPIASSAMRVVAYFLDNIPPVRTILIGGPLFLLWSYLCLRFAAYLKIRRGFKTGYSRKTFHLLTFITVAILQKTAGLPLVCLFGGMTSLVVAYAIFRGDGHGLFEAMAREQDAPHRTYYIVIPFFTTLIGGLVSSYLVGPIALAGFLVGGLGDAVGEPVGTRWGRHRYVVPSLNRVKSTRSIEGSIAVLLVSLLAVTLTVMLSPDLYLSARWLLFIPAIGTVCALLEAVSPHGWDNAVMQVAPSLLVAALLTHTAA